MINENSPDLHLPTHRDYRGQMSGGHYAYRLTPGRRPTRDDLVDILDPAACADVVTVEHQRVAVDRFLADERTAHSATGARCGGQERSRRVGV